MPAWRGSPALFLDYHVFILCTRRSGGVRDHGHHASQHPSHSFLYYNKQQWHGTLELNHISSFLRQIWSIPSQEPFVAFVWFVISRRIAVWYTLGVSPTCHNATGHNNKYIQLNKPIFPAAAQTDIKFAMQLHLTLPLYSSAVVAPGFPTGLFLFLSLCCVPL